MVEDMSTAELRGGDLSVLSAVPLVIAAGGGGAGFSDYCCGYGGSPCSCYAVLFFSGLVPSSWCAVPLCVDAGMVAGVEEARCWTLRRSEGWVRLGSPPGSSTHLQLPTTFRLHILLFP